MKSRVKQQILEQIGTHSIGEIADNLNLHERAVRKFLDRIKKKQLPDPTAGEVISRPWHKFLPLLLILLGGAVYANSFSGVFLLDDHHTIVSNQAIRSLWPPWVYLGKTRPLVYFTLAVNYAWSGLKVWSYHLVNVAIHLLAGLALFGLLKRTLLTRRLKDRFGSHAAGLAFASSLLWLLHPLQSQSVTYVIQRSEALMGLFYLSTLYCVIRSVGAPLVGAYEERAGTRPAPTFWYLLAITACALGMATKEVMVTCPILCLLYDRIFLASSLREIMKKRLSLYLGLAATWGILGLTLLLQDQATLAKSAGFGENLTSLDYLLTQPGVILHYLKLSFWPHPLCFDYGWPVAKTLEAIALPLVLIGALLVAALIALRRHPEAGFLGAWFFLILSPTSSFLPIRDLAFEHRMYLPLAAVLVLVVLTAYQVFGKRLRPFLSSGFILIPASILGILTFQRNQEYTSDVRIWQDTVLKRPHNARGHSNLGQGLEKEGRLDEAIRHYSEALRLKPDYAKAHNNLGQALDQKGKLSEAIEHYQEALRIDSKLAEAHNNLGKAFSDQGKMVEAIAHYEEALRINPYFADAHSNLAVDLAGLGKLDEAIKHLSLAIAARPEFAEAHNNLGGLLAQRGQLSAATAHFRKALQMKPSYEAARQNLERALAELGKNSGDMSNGK